MRLFAICLALAAFAAADPVSLKLKLPKGKAVKVEQTLQLVSNGSPSSKMKNGGTMTVITQTPFVLTEKWTDTCVDEKDGAPSEIKRAMTMSRIASAKSAAAPTELEGCVLRLSRADKKSTVKVEQGKPDDLCTRLLEKGPPEIMELLLPAFDVNEGDEWKVDSSCNSGLQMAVSAGKAGAQGNAKNALREDIDRMDDKKSPIGIGTATSGGCEVKAKLKSVKDGVATIEFSGEETIDKAKIANAGDADIPNSKNTVEGSLTFNVGTGQPVKLTWHQKHVVDDMDTKNGKWPGFTEDWALTRTYSK